MRSAIRPFPAAAAAALCLLPPPAPAGVDVAGFPVQLTVVPVCRFQDTAGRIDFGLLDVAGTAPAAAQATLRYACTRGILPSASAGPGLHADGQGRRRMARAGGGEYLPYALTVTPDPRGGSGPAGGLLLTVRATIDPADFRAAAIGDYADTVVLTITP